VTRHTDPREILVSTQSALEVKDVADQVAAMSAGRGPGKPALTISVDAAEGATFPYAWYFRHLGAGYPDLSTQGEVPPSDVLILTEASKTRLDPMLNNYD
jgi:predicted membrane-bound mannosyltransferase